MKKDVEKFLKNNIDTIISIKKQYAEKERTVISEKLINKIKKDDCLDELSKIAVLLDSKFLDKSNFSEEQKELMIETAYSQYEFLNKNLGTEIKDYLQNIYNNLKEINNKEKAFPGSSVYVAEGYYTNHKIYLSKKRLEENDNDNKYFVTKFCHELNHCYLGDSLLKSCVNDMFTESAVYEILKENFPEYTIKDKDFTIQFSDGDSLKTKVVQEGYSEISLLCESFNKVTENETLKKHFFKSFSETEIRELNEIDSKYNKFYESKKLYKGLFDKDKFLELENALEKLITKEVLKRNLDSKKVEVIIMENPRELQKNKINLNEEMFERINTRIELRENAKKENEKFINEEKNYKPENDFKNSKEKNIKEIIKKSDKDNNIEL